MNQILDYSPNKNSGGQLSKSDKIVRVFAVLLIIFALCLLGVGGYTFYKNKSSSKESGDLTNVSKAKITIEQDDSNVIIKIEHDKIIKEVTYNWDDAKETSEKGNDKSSLEIKIPAIAGEHTLNVKVIDSNNNETTYSETITSSSGEDKMMPVIDWEIVPVETDGEVTKKLKITATDETAIDFVTYRWNQDEEQRVDVSEEDEKKIEFTIDILKGDNDLVIVAVDKNNNKASLPKSFSGVTKPEVKITVSADKKSAEIVVTHDNGLKPPIMATVNDQEYKLEDMEEGVKEITFELPLKSGNNKVKIEATSVDNTTTTAEKEIDAGAEEDLIDIKIEKNAEDDGLVSVVANSSSGIKKILLKVNDQDYDVPIEQEGLPGVQFDIPIEDGNSVITVTVISTNDTEKTETKEISR